MPQPYAQLLQELLQFVRDEQAVGQSRLLAVWQRPLAAKREDGWTQAFTHLSRGEDASSLWAHLADGDSRFREGDLLVLHNGDPLQAPLGRRFALEAEDEQRWLLRGQNAASVLADCTGACYADPDALDLTAHHERTLDEISRSEIGQELLLPLLTGELEPLFDDRDLTEAIQLATELGMNARQAEAVGLAVGAEHLACIQGPPGTGKTRVLAAAVQQMVRRGERVLVTSHTHMAIHNALNKIHELDPDLPLAKIGRATQRQGLLDGIACHPNAGDWSKRPTDGYVIGATPFATCTPRLEHHEFDTIVFDEASQITVPLALMAMRKGRKFVFIGDHQQLPPVMPSRSVLDKHALAVFARLTRAHADHGVMLTQTYRMNRWLAAWPSRTYYDDQLVAAGPNRDRHLPWPRPPQKLARILDASASGVFIPSLQPGARTLNAPDAQLVVELCAAAAEAGLALKDIAIVTPYRAQGRLIRERLAACLGASAAKAVVADTVERMQGQERELVILSLATNDDVFLQWVGGFFFQPERLNVAITRAISKLIVIGPDLRAPPPDDDAPLSRWVRQYIEFTQQLVRVDPPG